MNPFKEPVVKMIFSFLFSTLFLMISFTYLHFTPKEDGNALVVITLWIVAYMFWTLYRNYFIKLYPEKDEPYKRHPMDTSGINPNVIPFNDKDIPGRY